MNTRRQILVVDDDATVRLLLEAHFRAKGFACLVATDGAAALAILDHALFQVLITDLEMHGMGGIDLLRALRSRKLITRCVVVTGYATVSNLTTCIREGAVALVPKPLDDWAALDRAVDDAFEQMQRWSDQMGSIVRLRGPAADDEMPGALVLRSEHAC
jgi:DNA-binding NtrC family response regulator